MATTLTASFPFGGGSQVMTDDEWRQFSPYLGMTSGVGVYGEEVGNQFEVFADSTGAQVKVKSGECYIKGSYGYHSSQVTHVLGGTTPSSGQRRIDVVVLRLDLTNKRIEVAVKNGTPAATASAVPPTLTTSATIWEIPLAHVWANFPGTTIAAGDVTDARIYARARNGWAPGDSRWWSVGNNFPTGFGFADGQAVSRITYSELAAIIDPGGTSATFLKPDYRGEVLTALDDMGTGAAGRISGLSMTSVTAHYGEKSHTIATAELPAHVHTIDHDHANASIQARSSTNPFIGTVVQSSTGTADGAIPVDIPAFAGNSGSVGSGTAVNLIQPTHVGYWLIAMRPV